MFGGLWTERLDIPDEGEPGDPIIVRPVEGVEGELPILDGGQLVGGQPLRVAGRHVRVRGFEVRSSENQCVDVSGEDVWIEELEVHDCVSHGVLVSSEGRSHLQSGERPVGIMLGAAGDWGGTQTAIAMAYDAPETQGSAARDAGEPWPDQVPLDFEARERITGDSPGVDVGAMEHGDPEAPAAFDGWW